MDEREPDHYINVQIKYTQPEVPEHPLTRKLRAKESDERRDASNRDKTSVDCDGVNEWKSKSMLDNEGTKTIETTSTKSPVIDRLVHSIVMDPPNAIAGYCYCCCC